MYISIQNLAIRDCFCNFQKRFDIFTIEFISLVSYFGQLLEIAVNILKKKHENSLDFYLRFHYVYSFITAGQWRNNR